MVTNLLSVFGPLFIVAIFIFIVATIGVFVSRVTKEFKDKGESKAPTKEENKRVPITELNEQQKAIVKKARAGGKALFVIGILGIIAIIIFSIVQGVTQQHAEPFFPTALPFVPICVVMIVIGSIIGFSNSVSSNLFSQNSQNTNEAQKTTQEPKKSSVYRCDYCGSVLEDSDKRCPGCGARRKLKKD